jgi:hypothetical protein
MILKPTQRAALERALSTVKSLDDAIRYMEEIAKVSPIYQERVAQMRDRQRYLITLAETAITADSSSLKSPG